ncbi:hypothetical protein [Nonomuraea dietziae]|uniref:Uncharacterized protein n=1 Tax=Nonomuraea dietziae TaxID=65515 RepID=A0A7W5V9K3_9ACTN|nr:hypothetical protein [Nonomuraea dietziae]MBB3727435.1 hypothetical protein [Nonomuraea dietziae]
MPTTQLLASAFGYDAANVIPTFGAVRLDVRPTIHTTMIKADEPVMRSAVALAILTSFGLATPVAAGRGCRRSARAS